MLAHPKYKRFMLSMTSNTAPDASNSSAAIAAAPIAAISAATPDATSAGAIASHAPAALALTPAAAEAATETATAAAAATPQNPSESPAQQARALLKQLQTRFPAFRDCLPLAIGVDKQLHAALPELNRKVLRIALGIHTNSLRYLRVMEKATHRYDLAGIKADEVSDAHRKHASDILRERFKKDADQRKAQRAAAEAEKAIAEAARIHAEKLSQLSEKFSRKK